MRQTLFHPTLAEKAENLATTFQTNYSQQDIPDLFSELDSETNRQFNDYLTGIETYRAHPYTRKINDLPAIWREGNTCLHDYTSLKDSLENDRPILLIPSLINRGYIFDLEAKRSFARYLTENGYPTYLVNWNHPDAAEKQFNLEDYILRLTRICQHLIEKTGKEPIILGYCMGGTLATGLASIFPELVHSLIALATPWDFNADGGKQKAMLSPAFPLMEQQINAFGQLPTDTLQLCFGLLDPMLSLKKFTKFSQLEEQSEQALSFVALEDWLNDGVPLAGPTAKECLFDWYQENTPAKENWLLNGKIVQPQHFDRPSLCIIPITDRIVPPESALALANTLPLNITLKPSLGHIGMMSASRAEKLVWEPIIEFIKALPR
ncbi:alpha/beta fold hydrolase [Curvivirga aplysinae]|uniref:alpha/beta fold hydrolase n=1 Tax=Curvivirga aplysinae TaxID=2529852 RepID=UPI001C3FD2BB|nr:alpha/beta fold hydrolase [Curvivirga aplysinae]